jgi:hypothetical protein
MWHRLKNLFSSLKTYDALSPSVKVRRQVNRALRHRPALDVDAWFKSFYQLQGVAYPIVSFAYTHLEKYSGIQFSQVHPSDRLNEDLHWTQVCWFDWQLALCDDFYHCHGIDISDCLDELPLLTIEDLILFLDQKWAQAKRERLKG